MKLPHIDVTTEQIKALDCWARNGGGLTASGFPDVRLRVVPGSGALRASQGDGRATFGRDGRRVYSDGH